MAGDAKLAERHIRRIYDTLVDARRRFLTGEYGLGEFHQAISTLTDQISGIVQSMDDAEGARAMASDDERIAQGDLRWSLQAVLAAMKQLKDCTASVKAPGSPIYDEFNAAGQQLQRLYAALVSRLDDEGSAGDGG